MKHCFTLSSLFTHALILIMGFGMSSTLFANNTRNLGQPSLMKLFEPSILDARGEALGHSSLLTSSGANNVFNNPVMMALQDRKNISVNSRSVEGENKYNKNGYNYKNKYIFYPVMNGVAFSMPIPNNSKSDYRYGIGFGYRKYYDYGLECKYYKQYDYTDDFMKDYALRNHTKSIGGFDVLTISGASWYRKIGLGVSINLGPSSYLKEKIYAINDEEEDVSGGKIYLSGRFVTLSMMYQPIEKLSLAIRHRLPYKLKVKYGNPVTIGHMDIPAETVIAAAYEPIRYLTIDGELCTRNTNDYPKIYDYPKKLSDGYGAHLGIECGDKVQIRVGVYTQSSDYADLTTDNDGNETNNKDTNMEQGITTGLGYREVKNVSINLAYSYSTLQYKEKYTDESTRGITYKANRSKIFCTVGVNF